MENVSQIMDITKNILIPLLVFLSGFLGLKSIGYKIVTKILTSATKWIQELEKDQSLSGPEKMELVISYIKDFIPRFLHVVFSEKVVEAMAESVFEDMQKYSENRVERKTGLNWEQMLQAVESAQSSIPLEAGMYTFKDGTTIRYVNLFEKNLLEYMDNHDMIPEVDASVKEG